jgi:hypothetical protein
MMSDKTPWEKFNEITLDYPTESANSEMAIIPDIKELPRIHLKAKIAGLQYQLANAQLEYIAKFGGDLK